MQGWRTFKNQYSKAVFQNMPAERILNLKKNGSKYQQHYKKYLEMNVTNNEAKGPRNE